MKCKHISNKIQMNLKYHPWNLICSTLLPLLLSVSKSFLISVSESNFLVSLIKSEMFLTLDTYSHQQLSIGLRCAININYLVIFSVCNGQKEAFYTMVKSFSVHQEIYFIIMCLHLFGYFSVPLWQGLLWRKCQIDRKRDLSINYWSCDKKL